MYKMIVILKKLKILSNLVLCQQYVLISSEHNSYKYFITGLIVSNYELLTWVVFPEPVSPVIRRVRLELILRIISSLCWKTGKVLLNESNSVLILAGGTCATPLLSLPIVALAISLFAKISRIQFLISNTERSED